MNSDDYIKQKPFSLNKNEKEKEISTILRELTIHHYENCVEYKHILDAIGFSPYKENYKLSDIPPIPVRLFKELELKSVSGDQLTKKMTSSGSSGQKVSKLLLDRRTAMAQQNVGVKITAGFLGIKRMPLIIVDSPSVLKSREAYTARGAAALFFSLFGSDIIYALKDDMSLDLDAVDSFLEKHSGESILTFGFTFMVWQHLYNELVASNRYLDLNDGILIHSGGWKKMESLKVSEEVFQKAVKERCGISHVYNEYGMAEQSGTIYYQCEHGFYHSSIYSDVLVRNPDDLSICEFGKPGLLELASILPHSYPGHVILSEDEGIICGEDDCKCGRLGKYFKVLGRVKNAELRGCSDTYASQYR